MVVAGGFPVPSSAVSLSEQLSLQDLTIMVGDPITLMVVVPTMVVAPTTVAVPTMVVVVPTMAVVPTMVGDPITLMAVVPTMVMAIIGDRTEIGESSNTAGLL